LVESVATVEPINARRDLPHMLDNPHPGRDDAARQG
jgi:hypothetical protein